MTGDIPAYAGKPSESSLDNINNRNIPTYAGKTPLAGTPQAPSMEHPRVHAGKTSTRI